jgi:CBS domain-containing protein
MSMASQEPALPADVVGKARQRDVISTEAATDVVGAARLMREKHVGFLVVTEPGAQPTDRKVVGVLTDRDLVVTVLAREADPRSLTVGDVMTRNPLLVGEDCPLEAALGFMRDAGVRRAPVVGQRGELCGVLSVDDVLERIAEQLSRIAGSIRGEQRTERLVRP